MKISQLTDRICDTRKFFDDLQTYGGGDDWLEDWVSGYDYLLHKINWKDNSIKIVIHICDAEGHGTSFKCNSLYTNFYY